MEDTDKIVEDRIVEKLSKKLKKIKEKRTVEKPAVVEEVKTVEPEPELVIKEPEPVKAKKIKEPVQVLKHKKPKKIKKIVKYISESESEEEVIVYKK